MSTILGLARRRAFALPLDDVLFTARGFQAHDEAARELLEYSARQVAIGFEFGAESRDADEAVTRLETLDQQFRGFAYEGAAMALAVLDAMRPGPRGARNERFLEAGRGAAHIYMAYIGIGMAAARLPPMLRARTIPDISKLPDHPALSWMIWDGYGFHEAFFRPGGWIRGQRVARLGWARRWTPASYLPRAVDQGVGRAIWFWAGASVDDAAAAVETFAPDRRADLWSGLGVAASYAGGVGAAGLERLARLAGPHQSEVALGAVLALKARVLAGTVSEHSHLAAKVLCGSDPVTAAGLTNTAAVDLPPDGEVPAYEEFRRRIREHFAG